MHGLQDFKPEPGFWSFYRKVLASCGLPMLGVFVTVEGLIAAVHFFVLLASKQAASDLWEFVVDHPYVPLAPALLGVGWVFLTAAHRQHEQDTAPSAPVMSGQTDTRTQYLTALSKSISSGSNLLKRIRIQRLTFDRRDGVRIWRTDTADCIHPFDPEFASRPEFGTNGLPSGTQQLEDAVRASISALRDRRIAIQNDTTWTVQMSSTPRDQHTPDSSSP